MKLNLCLYYSKKTRKAKVVREEPTEKRKLSEILDTENIDEGEMSLSARKEVTL